MLNQDPYAFGDEFLRESAGADAFKLGRELVRSEKVHLVEMGTQHATLTVSDRYLETVDLKHTRSGLRFLCSCENASRGEFCSHHVASAIFLREHLKLKNEDSWKEPMNQVIKELMRENNERPSRPFFLIFSLRNDYNAWSLLPYTLEVSKVIELTGKGLEEQSGQSIIDLIRQNAWLGAQAKQVQRSLDPADCVNGNPSIVSLANVIQRTEGTNVGYYFYSYTRPIQDYLALLASPETPMFLSDGRNPLKTPLRIWPDPGRMKISISRTEDNEINIGTQVDLNGTSIALNSGEVRVLAKNPLWVLYNEEIFQVAAENSQSVQAIFLDNPSILIPQSKETEFLETYLLPIADSLPVNGEQIQWEEIRSEPTKRLYFTEEDGDLVVRLFFGYGEVEVPYDTESGPVSTRHKNDGTWTLVKVHRKVEAEEAIYKSISGPHSGLKYLRGEGMENAFGLRARLDIVDFLLKKVPILLENGFEIFGEEDLRSARVNREHPTMSLNVSSGIDWFDLLAVVRFGNVEVSLTEVRRALRKKNRYVKLADGTIGELPKEWVLRYKHLFGLGEQTENGVRLSLNHLTLVEELLSAADETQGDAAYEEQLKRLKDFAGIDPVSLPDGFAGKLRPYQKAGYDWLHFLKSYDFGGCLADDMGLGKTVQVLVFLQSIYENGMSGQASLVVIPRSLLFNWHREANQFTPGLRILEHFGQGRGKTTRDFRDYDIILTTYGTMRRDIQLLRSYKFAYAILDESQAIKNPLAQVSKAARLLNADHRLVMTGTPVENSTYELWSQFAFLNPGLLGGLEYFKREFANPIERGQDESAADILRKLVFPFILRRTKSQVAPELPSLTERIVYGEMEPAQKKLYEKARDNYRNELLGLIETRGLNDTRMKILEGLLRLRQIANHPVLVDNLFKGKSTKMELLMKHLDTLNSEGHKALIFSQFVQMLKLIRKELDGQGIPYAYLDGQTQDRQAQVDAFQDDLGIPFFLISLRAGGVGLNLTAADYVIHVDPWWNPAVEMQATDRTHRIGQEKPVFVYKLITRDTVEEKILQLQEQKRDLVDRLISTESNFFKDLTQDDVQSLFS